MKKMTSNEIRKMWIDYFTQHGHKYVESASLIPVNDNSLLWINAGVTPLKKFFDGSVVPESSRLVNIQKCIRTNDIENVGVTKRHLTFFEMMGNFSIGDYFKDEAIEFAYELLTSKDWFAIPLEKLYVTIYTHDDEAYKKWVEVGLKEDHLIRLDGNFWEIGEGPCGPDSEIFYDRGEKYDPNHDALEKLKQDEEQERYVEIWNNVFSQYNSKPGVPREKYQELPHKNIDTGAGLERWSMIFQDVPSIFETDLLAPIIRKIEEMSGILYNDQTSFKVIADHIKAITFALADGAYFENTGRGYVLRRLLRRSVRLGKGLGLTEPFLYKLVGEVVEIMKDYYTYLPDVMGQVKVLVLEEEKLFFKTLDAGERRLLEIIDTTKDHVIKGYDAFTLYDTYGFPLELTLEIAKEKGFKVDEIGFHAYMQKQKEAARKSIRNKTAMASQKEFLMDFKKESKFVYGLYRLKSNILAIVGKDKLERTLTGEGFVILKRTCFYATSGGQVADTGMIIGKNFKARVIDVFKAPNGQHIHQIKLLDGSIEVGEDCEAIVDKDRRKMIECNHSSVHMLQYALQQCIDKNIRQAGSYVDDTKLRFDFTSSVKLTEDQIVTVEDFVNKMIQKGIITSTEIMPLDKAKKLGAMALFDEKYGDEVRVVKIDKSIELCGGTHVANTKDIKRFAISSYESKGSNTYRIEGCTGSRIESTLFEIIKPYNDEMVKLLLKAKEILENARKHNIKLTFDVEIDNSKPVSYKDIIFNQNELNYIQAEVKNLEKRYMDAITSQRLSNLDDYIAKAEVKDDTKFLFITLNNEAMDIVKALGDNLCEKMGPSLVFIANIKEDHSLNFICRSSIDRLNAGYLVKQASKMALGNGGGSATFAQGGGKDGTTLPAIQTMLRDYFNE